MADDRCELLCLDLPRAEELRRNRVSAGRANSMAGRARALADPTRLVLAAALRDADELCVCDLAWISERAQNLVSHHLRTLRAGQLVTSRRDGKMVMYALTDEGRRLVDAVAGPATGASGKKPVPVRSPPGRPSATPEIRSGRVMRRTARPTSA